MTRHPAYRAEPLQIEDLRTLLDEHDPETCLACARERRSTETAELHIALAALQLTRLLQLTELLDAVETTAKQAHEDSLRQYLAAQDTALSSLDYIRAAAAVSRERVAYIMPFYETVLGRR